MPTFVASTVVPEPLGDVFAWHERRGAFTRLAPPWQRLRVEQPPEGLQVGTRAVLRLPPGIRWVAEHVEYDPPRFFRDVQRSGPFAEWDHRHFFAAETPASTRLTDEVRYRVPLGQPGAAVGEPIVWRQLKRMFRYRHDVVAGDLAVHAAARARGVTPMHVAVTGASGLIGSQLVAFLQTGGHRVTRLVRSAATRDDEVHWDPDAGEIDAQRLRGVDAVVHLAGAPIARPWTAQQRRRILDSRVRGTTLLARTLAQLDDGPRVLVCSSGINAYGADRGDEVLTEASAPGGGFLGDVVAQWEAAADPARAGGVRVVHVRTGIVQSPAGGTLGLQLPLFQLGLGGRLGSGRQWVSWITIDDVIGLFHHALVTPEVSGPLNATAPNPVRNRNYTRVLGAVLRRPTLLPVPPLGPALLLGRRGAQETALSNLRVLPSRAEATGYRFRHTDLEQGLRYLFGLPRS